MSAPRLSVVIVSYRVRELLRGCLASLARGTREPLEVWVVDNASGDGTLEMLAAEFPHVHVIANRDNVGFAAANNQALERATGEWLLLLNPDTVVEPGALDALVEAFRRHPRAGVVGLEVRNADGSPQPWVHAYPGVLNQLVEAIGLHRLLLGAGYGTVSEAPAPPGGEGEVDWVSGACMALSRRAYEQVGGLEPRLFLYGEEMDWSWRARARGFSTVATRRGRVLHHGGASGTGARGALFVRLIEARLSFLRRHRGAWRAALSREILTLGCALRWLAWRLRSSLERVPAARTRDQIERFRAVLAWRLGGAA